MAAATVRNLHVPLPEALYRRLRVESERSHRPATELAREAIHRWLDELHQAAVYDAVTAYATEHAGTAADLDPALESAAIEQLLEHEKSKK